jgi:homoserine kinase
MSNLPELFSLQKMAMDSGALMSTLSGSGSTFFNMAYRCDARYLRKTLANKFPQYRVEIVEFDNRGVFIEHH